MKPTFQNVRPVRRGDSVRAAHHTGSKCPITDWNFQTSTADLRGTSVPSHVSTEQPAVTQSFYGLSSEIFAAETKWADRIEGIGLAVVIALAGCPVAHAIYIALRTT